MTKGWCPLHDRIVDSRNGTCPECGTPLVDLTARPRETGEARLVVEDDEPEPEPEPIAVTPAPETRLWPDIRLPERFFGRGTISIGPAAIAGILIAAVVASFLVGLAIPRGGSDDAPEPTVRRSRALGTVRSGPGLDLRLERFRQDGFRISMRVTVENIQGADVGRIQAIDITALLDDGLDPPPSMSLEVRQTINDAGKPGFIAEGTIPIAVSRTITGVRIEAVYFSSKVGADFALDLSGLGPSSSGAPRVKVIRSPRRPVGLRQFAVSDVVGWPDRLEVRMDVTGGRESWVPDEAFTLVLPSEATDGYVNENVKDASAMHLVFGVLPPWHERSVLRVTLRGLSVHGEWTWEFA